MPDTWGAMSLDEARRFCVELTPEQAQLVVKILTMNGPPYIAGRTRRLAVGASGLPEVQRPEGDGWVRDMGDGLTPNM